MISATLALASLLSPTSGMETGPPVAAAGGPYNIAEGDAVTLDGSGSVDPQLDPLTYEWDLDNDGTYGDVTGEGPTVSWSTLQAYGVDEFMYFVEGGVTLTSSDGTVTEIRAGDAVTIPKEWTGVWDTNGYKKIWVIYSADGSGL